MVLFIMHRGHLYAVWVSLYDAVKFHKAKYKAQHNKISIDIYLYSVISHISIHLKRAISSYLNGTNCHPNFILHKCDAASLNTLGKGLIKVMALHFSAGLHNGIHDWVSFLQERFCWNRNIEVVYYVMCIIFKHWRW